MADDDNKLGIYDSKNSFVELSIFVSVVGLGISGYWIFNDSKTTKDIDDKIKIVNTDNNLIIIGAVLTALGAAAAITTITLSHKKSHKNSLFGTESTFKNIFLYFQHVLSLSCLLALSILYGTFSSAPQDSIPKVYLHETLIISSISLFIIIVSGALTHFSKSDSYKISKQAQHILSGIIILASVSVSASYLNSGNIPSVASGVLCGFSVVGILITIYVFITTYKNSLRNYKLTI